MVSTGFKGAQADRRVVVRYADLRAANRAADLVRVADPVENTTVNKELELIERAKAKDTRAFAQLVEFYQERAIHAAYSFIGNFEDARDIAQEAFVKAYDHLAEFKAESRFTPGSTVSSPTRAKIF